MRRKYITKQVLLACRSRRHNIQEDIHAQLATTIAERKGIIQQWKNILQAMPAVMQTMKKDIHDELKETIAEHTKMMEQWRGLLSPAENSWFIMKDKKAA